MEYAIAQLGALQVWKIIGTMQTKQFVSIVMVSPKDTVTLPNSRRRIRFDFSFENLSDLIGMVREEMKIWKAPSLVRPASMIRN